MQGRRPELRGFLDNLEIEVHLDKLRHGNRSRRWVAPVTGRRSDGRYLSQSFPGPVAGKLQAGPRAKA